jgi:hypothetical protein
LVPRGLVSGVDQQQAQFSRHALRTGLDGKGLFVAGQAGQVDRAPAAVHGGRHRLRRPVHTQPHRQADGRDEVCL